MFENSPFVNHPRFPFLKLILLYILEMKGTQFPFTSILNRKELRDLQLHGPEGKELEASAFYDYAAETIKTICNLNSELKANPSPRRLQQRETLIAELLPGYPCKDYLSLKNVTIESSDKKLKSGLFDRINFFKSKYVPGENAKKFFYKEGISKGILGGIPPDISDIVDEYIQLVKADKDKVSGTDHKNHNRLQQHLCYALVRKNVRFNYLYLTLPEQCVVLKAKLMLAFFLQGYFRFDDDSLFSKKNNPLLCQVFSTKNGSELFQELLGLNILLPKEITGEALCQPLSGEDINDSALYWLSGCTGGLGLFQELLRLNPPLAKQITGEALCRSLTGEKVNRSALYNFFVKIEGHELFQELLRLNPPLAKQITGEALCRHLLLGRYANTSPLFGLCIDSRTHKTLQALLQLNHQLAKEISGEALCRYRPLDSEQPNISPLFLLCSSSSGQEILHKLLELNPRLAKEISGEALCRYRPLDSEQPNTSALVFLCADSNEQAMLQKLLELNPQLAKEISGEALCRCLISTKYGNTSAFSRLVIGERGHRILQQLARQNPSIIAEIKNQAKQNPIIANAIESLIENTCENTEIFLELSVEFTPWTSCAP